MAGLFRELRALFVGRDGLGVLLLRHQEILAVVLDDGGESRIADLASHAERTTEVQLRGLRGPERDVGIAETRNDRRDSPQVTQLLGELEGGSETADRLTVLTERRLSLSQVNERGHAPAELTLSFVGAGRVAPARSRLFEGAAPEGLHALLEELLGWLELIRRPRGDKRQSQDDAEERSRSPRQSSGCSS